jgi:hypothetical protein
MLLSKSFVLFVFTLMVTGAVAQVVYPDSHLPGDIPQLFAKYI